MRRKVWEKYHVAHEGSEVHKGLSSCVFKRPGLKSIWSWTWTLFTHRAVASLQVCRKMSFGCKGCYIVSKRQFTAISKLTQTVPEGRSPHPHKKKTEWTSRTILKAFRHLGDLSFWDVHSSCQRMRVNSIWVQCYQVASFRALTRKIMEWRFSVCPVLVCYPLAYKRRRYFPRMRGDEQNVSFHSWIPVWTEVQHTKVSTLRRLKSGYILKGRIGLSNFWFSWNASFTRVRNAQPYKHLKLSNSTEKRIVKTT